MAKLVHGQAQRDDFACRDEGQGWGEAQNAAALVHEIAQYEPHGLESAQGEQYLQLRMVDGIELVDGILDVLAQVLVLKDKREVEEVEQQHGCSVEKRVAPGNEIGRERYGTRRHAHEHHDDGVEVERCLQSKPPR